MNNAYDNSIHIDLLTLEDEWQQIGNLINTNGWETLDSNMRKRFVRLSIERGYIRDYNYALELYERDGPQWYELTDEQRQTVRDLSREHAREMHEFGKSLAKGNSDEQ